MKFIGINKCSLPDVFQRLRDFLNTIYNIYITLHFNNDYFDMSSFYELLKTKEILL